MLVQDKTQVGYDKIEKCQWLVEKFVVRSKAVYNCEKYLACNEIMVAFKRRRCEIKKYMKDKPMKYGIKIWYCTSSKSCYMYNLIVYEGWKNQKPEKDLRTNVVLKLVSNLRRPLGKIWTLKEAASQCSVVLIQTKNSKKKN